MIATKGVMSGATKNKAANPLIVTKAASQLVLLGEVKPIQRYQIKYNARLLIWIIIFFFKVGICQKLC